jgi:predicted PurR-regulated permease PerM
MQFGTISAALLMAGVSVGLHTLSGYVLSPWLTKRTSRMSAVVVFVGVLAWGWLWGLPGLVPGVPILSHGSQGRLRPGGRSRGVGELLSS